MFRGRTSNIILPLALAIMCAPAAFAATGKPLPTKPIVETHTFMHNTVVNNTTVKPGEYRLVAAGDTLKIENMHHKILAESPITWQQGNHKYFFTKTDVDHGVLTKVNLGGTHEAVLLNSYHHLTS